MEYYRVKKLISNGKINDLQAELLAGGKNKYLGMIRDYYSGNQWITEGGGRRNLTRSGKVFWENKSSGSNSVGYNLSDLKTWNVCDAVTNIYTSYVRGNINDSNVIGVTGNDALSKNIANWMNLDDMIVRIARRASIDSVCVLKYRSGSGPEFVDPTQVYPIYFEDERVGIIRMYYIVDGDPIIEKIVSSNNKASHLYTEIWLNEDGNINLYKYIDQDLIENGVSDYKFDPFIIINNADAEFANFDEKNIEMSDVARIIDIQDDLNTTITDISIINRKVAIPLLKIADSVYNAILGGKIDGERLKRDLENLTISANRIVCAPIERMETNGLPQSAIVFVESILDHLYRITGIPATAFVSGGVSNISAETVGMLTESLRRRVDEKRNNIKNGLVKLIGKYAIDNDVYYNGLEKDVSIVWAETSNVTKIEQARLAIDSFNSGLLPQEYVVEKILDAIGDKERLNQIIGMTIENSLTARTNAEINKLYSEINSRISTNNNA